MASLKFDKEITALLVIDPYNDFISERGKLWDRLKAVAEANSCVPHMLQVLNAARKARLRVFYALHRRYRPGDYETWKYIAPVQKAAWLRKSFEYGTWGGEIRCINSRSTAPHAGQSRTSELNLRSDSIPTVSGLTAGSSQISQINGFRADSEISMRLSVIARAKAAAGKHPAAARMLAV
jgi:hypothetical protein